MEGHIAILLTWLILLPLFAGVGALLARLFVPRLGSVEAWFLAFWGGLAAVILVLQIWHFAFPVNDAARLLFVIVGASGIAWNGRDLWRVIRARRGYWPVALVLVLFAVWLANRSIGEPVVYETGLYHINVVQWSGEYPVVPGLGNLHSRLGFSNAYFLYPALLDFGYWSGRTHHITNGLLFLALFAQIVTSGVIILRRRELDMYHTFQALFIPVIWLLLLSETILPSLSNDPAVFALGIVIAGQALNLIQTTTLPRREAFYRIFLIVLIAAVGTAVKFSFVVFGAALSLLALVVWINRYGVWRPGPVIARMAFLGGVAFLVFLPMFARSVMMTGYPLYPITLAAFPVEWRIDAEHAQLEYEFIQVFARQRDMHPYTIPEDWDWFGAWLESRFRPKVFRDHFYFSFPLLTTIGAAGLIAASEVWRRIRRGGDGRRLSVYYWLFLLPALLAIGFWFYSAPDPRFAGASLWSFAFGLTIIALSRINWGAAKWQIYLMPVAVAVIMIAPFPLDRATFWVEPAENPSGLYLMPKPYLKTYESDYGVAVNWPTQNNQCWGAPIPCTPYPHPNLEPREPGDYGAGFVLEIGPDDPPQVID